MPTSGKMPVTSKAPFSLITSFASDPFAGNPAAVVFLDISLPLEEVGKIARNLNQPILVAVSPESGVSEEQDPKVEYRFIRFFTPKGDLEVPICGHGTLAAAKAVFDLRKVKMSRKEIVRFKNFYGHTLEASKTKDGWIEITIPSTIPGEVDADEKRRLKGFVDRSFGRDVEITDIKTGGAVYPAFVMIEVDESEDLATSVLDAQALIGNGYSVNVFTSSTFASTPNPRYSFISRMFAPKEIEGGEDHVCGTAHGILTPHWTSKLGLTPGEEIWARQVSKRGGDLRIVWNKDAGMLRLRGKCAIFATGELQLS